MSVASRMIVPFVTSGAMALCAMSAVAQGSSPENGACFELGEDDARLCVPVDMTLIEVEVNNGHLRSHFERDFLTVTIRTFSNPQDLPIEQGLAATFEHSQTGGWLIPAGSLVTRLGALSLGSVTVLEARTSTSDMNEHYLEISAPSGTMVILVSGYSPGSEGAGFDFEGEVNLIRLLTTAGGHQLPDLDYLEPWGMVQ